jgi:hypothetical protein
MRNLLIYSNLHFHSALNSLYKNPDPEPSGNQPGISRSGTVNIPCQTGEKFWLPTHKRCLQSGSPALQGHPPVLQRDIPALRKGTPSLQNGSPALHNGTPALQSHKTALQRASHAMQNDKPGIGLYKTKSK